VELNRAATVLTALDTDCAGATVAVFGDPDAVVTAELAATVLGELVGAVTNVAAAAGLETVAATGAAVASGLAARAVGACDWLAIPVKTAEIPLVSMLPFLRVEHLSVIEGVGRSFRFFREKTWCSAGAHPRIRSGTRT
jgi:hypothetical protein